jgi:hypothetical protein
MTVDYTSPPASTTSREAAPRLSIRDLDSDGRRIWAAMEQVLRGKNIPMLEGELLRIETDIENAIGLLTAGRISLLRWIDDDLEGHGRLVLQTPHENVQLFTYARPAMVMV